MQSENSVLQRTPPLPNPAVSGLAIASLVCGILGFFTAGITGVAAAICGHFALSKIKRFPQSYSGRGLAIAGLILGYLTFLVAVFSVISGGAILLMRGKVDSAKSERAQADMHTLNSALQTYLLNTGRYPTTRQGLEALMGKSLSKIPKDPWDRDYVYRYPGKKNPNEPEILSLGKDGLEGTADDLNSQDF